MSKKHGHVNFLEFVIWCTYYAFSLFQPSGSCKFFCFKYYTSNSNPKNGASWHHYRPVACICTPWSLTWNLKRMVSKRNLLFQEIIFRFHVKLQGCKSLKFLVKLCFWKRSQKGNFRERKSWLERNPDIWGWLYWWTLWKIELRIGVRHMKNLPTMEISWILTHSICTRPISGSLDQLPEIMEEKAVAMWSW